MRLSSVLTLLVATVLAVLAGLLAQKYLDRQRVAAPPAVVPAKPATTKIVVAALPIPFGTPLSSSNLREIEWPADHVPAGTFRSIAELVSGAERRATLARIEVNEPILRSKITGPGQRASLSSVIEDSKRAVTIRVNDVLGVAGFVLPGDRVDVLLTRSESVRGGGDQHNKSYTEVLLQNVRVLAVDQLADEQADKPSVAKSVTLEVDLAASQRLALAGSLGSLTLSLRPLGYTAMQAAQRITPESLAQNVEPAAAEGEQGRAHVVGVTRGTQRSEYSVPAEKVYVRAAFVR